jgi:large subunit ribosomal protein L29
VSQTTELRQREPDDLLRDVAAIERQIWELRFQEGSEKAGNPSKIRQMRRQVARLMTVLRERELGIERAGAGSAEGSAAAEQGEDQ